MTNLSPFVPDCVGLGACAIYGCGFSVAVACGAMFTLELERFMDDCFARLEAKVEGES